MTPRRWQLLLVAQLREKARVNRAAFVCSILALLSLLRGAYVRVASVCLAECKRMIATVVNSVVLT